jgi:hypothetical protein
MPGVPCSLLEFESSEALQSIAQCVFSYRFRYEAAFIVQRSANRPRDLLGFLAALVKIVL